MRLTISKRALSQPSVTQQFTRSIKKDQSRAWPKQAIQTTQHHKIVQNSSQIPQNCCNKFLFFKCLNQQYTQNRIHQEEVLSFHSEEIKHKKNGDVVQNQQRSMKTQLKLKLTTVKNKNQEKSVNCPQYLEKFKELLQKDSQIKQKFRHQEKNYQNIETKRGTEVYPSPQHSFHAYYKMQEQSMKPSTLNSSLQFNKTNSNKKIQITISNFRKPSQLSQIKTIQEITLKQPKNQFNICGFQQIYDHRDIQSVCENRTQIYQSFNQLKIDDPLDQLQSNNTEYLKNKIAFSQVQSERELVNNYCNSSVFGIRSDNENQAKNHLFTKTKKICSLGIKDIHVDNEIQLSQNQLNSQQSFVVQKGIQEIFKMPSLKFNKISTKNQRTNQNISESVIVHDVSEAKTYQFWSKSQSGFEGNTTLFD